MKECPECGTRWLDDHSACDCGYEFQELEESCVRPPDCLMISFYFLLGWFILGFIITLTLPRWGIDPDYALLGYCIMSTIFGGVPAAIAWIVRLVVRGLTSLSVHRL